MPVPAVTNRLLAMLPEDERAGFLSHCDEVTLVSGETLAESGETYSHIYFPLSTFISLISVMNGKPALETGLIGAEGMLGATLALGVGSAPNRARVQSPGTALRVEADVFTEFLASHRALSHVVKHYLHVMIEQLTNTSACTRFHIVESRLARRLMMTRDRAKTDTLEITQQDLSGILGVRREGITEAAGRMQRRGLIHYRRGRLRILDRPGLETAACGCYEVDGEVYERIMGLWTRIRHQPSPL